MITELKPKVIKPERTATPQCCAPVDPPTHATMWRRDRYKERRPTFDPDKCQRVSVVEFNGHPYCRLHAGSLALERWLKGELVERRKKGKR